MDIATYFMLIILSSGCLIFSIICFVSSGMAATEWERTGEDREKSASQYLFFTGIVFAIAHCLLTSIF